MTKTVTDPAAIVKPAIEEIAADVHIKEAVRLGHRSTKAMILAGLELMRGKAVCGHGLWLDRLKMHGMPRRTAAHLMRMVAKNFSGVQMGKIAHLEEVFGAISHTDAPDEQEPPKRNVGDEIENHPVWLLIKCDRCQRKGQIPDCADCVELRSRAQGKLTAAGKKARKAKAGKVLFDWRDYHKHFSKVYQLPERVKKAYPDAAKSDDAKAITKLLTELAERIKSWETTIRGGK